jgi:peptidoglycan/xylan/chitin deacetylase (PgdA/CDA1 family)
MSRAGTFVVSLDFELLWGVRDQPGIEGYFPNLLGSRQAVPRILDRFAENGVRATWATVGMLFCESKEELVARLPERTPAYARPRLSPYGDVRGLGRDEHADPLHFAPSLIREIAGTPGQEVGTHTFSHFYCLERGQTAADFEADLCAAVDVARARGIDLRSIVFPRNQVNRAYLPICREHGLTAYRGNQRAWMHAPGGVAADGSAGRAGRLLDAYLPISRPDVRAAEPPGTAGLVNVPASRFFRPRPRAAGLFESRKVRRMLGELERAARQGAVYHLWWHPHNFGAYQDLHLAQLDAVLDRFSRLRAEGMMRSATMADLAREHAA